LVSERCAKLIKILDHDQLLRDLLVRYTLLYSLNHLVCGRRVPAIRRKHESHHTFTEVTMRSTDDRRFSNRGHFVVHGLDLGGIYDLGCPLRTGITPSPRAGGVKHPDRATQSIPRNAHEGSA